MIDVCNVPLKAGGHATPEEGFCIMPSDADLERFRMLSVPQDSGCILWVGTIMHKGYGIFHYAGRGVRAHKFSYLLSSPPIPKGCVLDHLCGNNPLHLEAVTPRENVLRSTLAPARINADKTHCPTGHAYSGTNLFVRKTGQRECVECGRAGARRYVAANRNLINARKRQRRAERNAQ